MRVAFLLVSVLLSSLQQPVITTTQLQRDSQAVALLQLSIAAMAKTPPPSDSSATGVVTIVEGATTQSGTIQILTLGTSATSEILNLPDEQRAITYSDGGAKETKGTTTLNPPMELALSDQCPDFPLPFLQSALSNPDTSIRYVGLETLDGHGAHHLQVWNSFASKPRLQNLSSFSLKDIWIDATSNLPLKVSYSRRGGGQGAPVFLVEISFSNYTNSGGILYPFQINKSFNGTPWQTITIQQVAFNTGINPAQFSVE
jgi:hypothetical protein